jgi:hypothetical protein
MGKQASRSTLARRSLDEQQKRHALDGADAVHRHNARGREVPTRRCSNAVALAIAWQGQRYGDAVSLLLSRWSGSADQPAARVTSPRPNGPSRITPEGPDEVGSELEGVEARGQVEALVARGQPFVRTDAEVRFGEPAPG